MVKQFFSFNRIPESLRDLIVSESAREAMEFQSLVTRHAQALFYRNDILADQLSWLIGERMGSSRPAIRIEAGLGVSVDLSRVKVVVVESPRA